jgi:hypothetical protein
MQRDFPNSSDLWTFLTNQGFDYIADYVTEHDEHVMIQELDQREWRNDLGTTCSIHATSSNVACYDDCSQLMVFLFLSLSFDRSKSSNIWTAVQFW